MTEEFDDQGVTIRERLSGSDWGGPIFLADRLPGRPPSSRLRDGPTSVTTDYEDKSIAVD